MLLALGPLWLDANGIDRLTTLFIYVILAVMWNALVGYCGLVSIGQQAFFGLGAYFAVRLADSGVSVYPVAVPRRDDRRRAFAAAIGVDAALKGGEFAIGMWVVAELAHLLVNLDTLINGETGTSLIALNAYPTDAQTRADLLVRARRHDWTSGGRVPAVARAARRRPSRRSATTRRPPNRSACA